ncbi:MAG: peptidylprolyl isomerase [Elusimicrobiales bacterium]
MKTAAITAAIACAAVSGVSAADAKPAAQENAGLKPGLYAVLNTTKGKIVCRLFEDKAPKTVANFVGLAEGTKEWTHPVTGKKQKTRFFDGLAFMRVIPGFMIQGGDPLNSCKGGPGYKFEDEFAPGLGFDKPGLLAMANAGPNTNGSQFFITDVPRGDFEEYPSYLNGKHAIFGEVVEGLNIVSAIADMPGQNGMAFSPAIMNKVEIVRVPKAEAKPAAQPKPTAKTESAK